jgi:serine protease Do
MTSCRHNAPRSVRLATRLVGSLATLGWAVASAATLAPGVQQKLDSATFEVVLAKPVADPLTYEKPLPLELIPYRERIDTYRSIGTAFAIGPNVFVSAAHVIAAGNSSQYGPLALRNAAGKTFQVDKILKYSSSEDYAVFSVRNPPALVPLATRSRPPMNTPVFAVGNALGEGVIVRDGLYTSDTPEERDGRWQWLRFSAAASPGNSGGPLIDRTGKVVGVVLRKSPNENLNFALAIGQVTDGSDQAATLESRSSYRMLIMSAADLIDLKESIPLPKNLDEFYAALHLITDNWMTKVRSDFLKAHKDVIFPLGNSEQLLTTVYTEVFPKFITQSDSGKWVLTGEVARKEQLEKNGFIQEGSEDGVFIVRLKAPDDVKVADLLSDSKKFMDLLLKGYRVTRPVGTDSVRVTSMGKASTELWDTDSYGRKWQIRSWLLPFNDTVVTTFALPTPDGMVMMMSQAPTALNDAANDELKGMRGFFYVSYIGTLAQWHAFLENTSALPATLASAKVQIDYTRGVGIKTPRFQMLVPASVIKIDDASELMLKYSYMRDGSSTGWDLGGVYLADSTQGNHWVGALRRVRPSPSLPEEVTRHWQSMTAGSHPWEGSPYLAAGRSEINALLNAKEIVAAKKNVGYSMTLNVEGNQPASLMKNNFSALEHGFTTTE